MNRRWMFYALALAAGGIVYSGCEHDSDSGAKQPPPSSNTSQPESRSTPSTKKKKSSPTVIGFGSAGFQQINDVVDCGSGDDPISIATTCEKGPEVTLPANGGCEDDPFTVTFRTTGGDGIRITTTATNGIAKGLLEGDGRILETRQDTLCSGEIVTLFVTESGTLFEF